LPLLPSSAPHAEFANSGEDGSEAAGIIFGIVLPCSILAVCIYLVVKHLVLVVRACCARCACFDVMRVLCMLWCATVCIACCLPWWSTISCFQPASNTPRPHPC